MERSMHFQDFSSWLLLSRNFDDDEVGTHESCWHTEREENKQIRRRRVWERKRDGIKNLSIYICATDTVNWSSEQYQLSILRWTIIARIV